MRAMRRLMSFFWSFFAVYLILLAALFFFQRSLLYLPSKDKPSLAAAPHPAIVEIETEPEPGLRLTHWYRPPTEPEDPVVVVFHGNAGHHGHRADKFLPLLQTGFGLLFAGYRGYGGNPGSPTEEGLSADGRSVADWLMKQGVAPERTVIMGESLGTAIAIKVAAERDVAAVVLEAPPSSIAEVAQSHYWYVPAKWLIHDAWNSLARIAHIEAPLLVYHGEADRTVPAKFGRKLFEAAKDPKESFFHPNASHNNLFAFPEIPERIIDFVRRHTSG